VLLIFVSFFFLIGDHDYKLLFIHRFFYFPTLAILLLGRNLFLFSLLGWFGDDEKLGVCLFFSVFLSEGSRRYPQTQ
jgi:hypothetical protein